MDVSKQGQPVPVLLDEKGLVPPLEQMSGPLMATVEVLRIGRLEPGHDPGKRDLPRLNGQMDVVVHQAVRQHPERELLSVEGQPTQVPRSVCVVPKDVSPLVASNDDVVKPAHHRHPQRPRHGRNNTILKD